MTQQPSLRIAELETHVPPIGRAVQDIAAGRITAEAVYPTLQSISIDHAVMERATRVDLECLPGIGEARAESILALRERNGGSLTLADLRRVQPGHVERTSLPGAVEPGAVEPGAS